MLKLRGLIIVAAFLAVSPIHAASNRSQPPILSAVVEGRPVLAPISKSEQKPDADKGTTYTPMPSLKTDDSVETKQEAQWNTDYQQRKVADEHAVEIGVAAIVVGALQTIALVITFLVIAFVAVRQLRAYIYGEVSGLIKFSLTEPIQIGLIWRNSGQTPALDFQCSAAVFFSTKPLPDKLTINSPVVRPGTKQSKLSFFPSTEQRIVADSYAAQMVPEVLADLKAGKATVYVYGEATYRDMFWLRRRTQICKLIATENIVQLIQAQEGAGMPPVEIKYISAHTLNSFT